jgi:hypothetical protein
MEPDLAVTSKVCTPATMAGRDSPLDEPLLAPGKDGDEDAASMEAQHLLRRDKGASFSRSCLNLSNVISGTRPPIDVLGSPMNRNTD